LVGHLHEHAGLVHQKNRKLNTGLHELLSFQVLAEGLDRFPPTRADAHLHYNAPIATRTSPPASGALTFPRMAPAESDVREWMEFAVEIGRDAGRLTLDYFNCGTPYELKSDQSPVTIADRSAEQRLRQRIEAAFPTHGVLGEELGETPGREPARWIIDPID